jgi:polyisoprenoid-binding protein YceI
MFRNVLLTTLAALTLGFAAQAAPTTTDPAQVPAGDYVLDSRHASLAMKTAHMGGFSNFAMRFDKLEGGFTYDPKSPAATKVNIKIDPASIHTGLPSFDKEIAGPRYFDAARFPAITFVSTKLDIAGEGRGQLTGDLTFMGKTRPVTLAVVFNGVGPGMMGAGTRMGFSGTGSIKKSDFDFHAADQFTSDEVKLDFEVEFTKR